MNYENYEDYMRSVLGYMPNTYYNETNQGYIPSESEQNIEEDTKLYPEIYKIVYPMVKKACSEIQNQDVTKELVDNITNIVYSNIEVGDINVSGNQSQTIQPELKNGDVINPRARTQQRETRGIPNSNIFLRDLIRILVLREFFDRRPPKPIFSNRPEPRPPFRPGMPPRIY